MTRRGDNLPYLRLVEATEVEVHESLSTAREAAQHPPVQFSLIL